jgi:type IV/VI secretion system ImpK/VasF family protein
MVNAFIDDRLVSSFFDFIGQVDKRLLGLEGRLNENSADVSDVVFEGVCLDMLQDVRVMSENVAAQNRMLSTELVSEFSYVLAAWVDELLIRRFSSYFPETYYGYTERTLFGTAGAGEKIFEKIERLVARKSQGDVALAAVYLVLLSLGFRGQYSVLDTQQKVLFYRRALVAFAMQDSPSVAALPWNELRDSAPAPVSFDAQLERLLNRKTAKIFVGVGVSVILGGIFWANMLWLKAVQILQK